MKNLPLKQSVLFFQSSFIKRYLSVPRLRLYSGDDHTITDRMMQIQANIFTRLSWNALMNRLVIDKSLGKLHKPIHIRKVGSQTDGSPQGAGRFAVNFLQELFER